MAMMTNLRPAPINEDNPKGQDLFVVTPDSRGAGLWVVNDEDEDFDLSHVATLARNGVEICRLYLWPELFNKNGGLKPRGVQLLRRVSEAAYKDGKLGA